MQYIKIGVWLHDHETKLLQEFQHRYNKQYSPPATLEEAAGILLTRVLNEKSTSGHTAAK